jgi:hypothetical protein
MPVNREWMGGGVGGVGGGGMKMDGGQIWQDTYILLGGQAL